MSGADSSGIDHAVRDWAAAKPRLREDIRFHYHNDRGQAIYVIEDLVNRRYLQVGLPEYRFIRALDGLHTVKELQAQSARHFGNDALGESEVAGLIRWLLDEHLLDSGASSQAERRYQLGSEQRARQDNQGAMKLLFLRVPLGSPDRLLSILNPLVGWTISRPFLIVWLGVVGWALYLAASHWRQLVHAGYNAVLPRNWISLFAVYLGLKLIHEIWHGLAAKRFGGVVPEWGVQLIALITPPTYVDASSSWSFPSRSRRMAVAAAGMYVEFLLAAIGMIVWVHSGDELTRTIAYNVVFSASAVTLLFNANPLMRFDGYYMLCDLLDIRNLGTKGQLLFLWIGKRFLLGMNKLPMPPETRQRTFLIGLYGVLSAIWRIVILIGILAILSTLFAGAGIILALLLATVTVVVGVSKFVRFLFAGGGGARPSMFKAGLRLGVLGAGLAALLFLVRIQPSPGAVGVIHFPDKAVMRAECPGFVSEIHCAGGQPVSQGQVLARMENFQERATLKKLELQTRRSELHSFQYLEADQLSAYQAELEVLHGLREKLSAQRSRVASLEFRAPVDGVVAADDLESLKGRYLSTGQKLLCILPSTTPELLISARQEDLPVLQQEISHRVRVRLRGREEDLAGVITRVESRATSALPHPALASSTGGPLLVRARPEAESERDSGLVSNARQRDSLTHFAGLDLQQWQAAGELVRPRFAAYANLEKADGAPTLREGEWGYVKLVDRQKQRLGVWLGERLFRYVRARFESAGK